MSPKDPNGHDVAHEMLRTIRQIVRRISEHSKYLAQEVGMTLPQLMCLKAIGELEEEGQDITVAKVSQQLQLSPATVSRIVDRLVRAHLVSRERARDDRRRVQLSLTAAGTERFGTLPTPMQERFVRRLMDLDEAERRGLLESLRRITALMDADELDAAPLLAPGDDLPPGPETN